MMVAPRRGSDPAWRQLVVVIVAVLLFGWVFLLRFNTLGGAFGGFDNDHFLHFVLAKQVQAGEQPIRDFLDAGLQGARPSLTYELSAAAQRHFGNNLRSEAWLTVGGVALGATVAFVAATRVASWPWALVTAWVSALLMPKLYGYPKVLVFAVASLLIAIYPASRPWWGVAMMSAWTAVAFLFRHDYAVYCGAGFLAVIAITGGVPMRARLVRTTAFALITVALLAPSLMWVQRHRGLTEYVRNALEMSRNEGERTRIGWPRPRLAGVTTISTALNREENTEAWLYYLFLGLPALAVGLVGWRTVERRSVGSDRNAVMLSISVMTAVAAYFLLRGNLAARFGDMAPPVAVLGAYLLSMASRRDDRAIVRRACAIAFGVVVLGTTVAAIWRLNSIGPELVTARLLEPFDVLARTRLAAEDLAAMPASLRESQAGDRMQAADYLHRCTRPSDRVLVLGYATDVLAFSERLFGGGRATYFVGFYMDERYSREAVAKLERESVPIVLGDVLIDDRRIPLIADYLRAHYDEVGTVMVNEGSMRVLVRRGVEGRPVGPNGLPCFG